MQSAPPWCTRIAMRAVSVLLLGVWAVAGAGLAFGVSTPGNAGSKTGLDVTNSSLGLLPSRQLCISGAVGTTVRIESTTNLGLP